MTFAFAYCLKISTNHGRAFIKSAMCNSSVIEGNKQKKAWLRPTLEVFWKAF
jgi:hypothetical protein